jgi:hypothetical protein
MAHIDPQRLVAAIEFERQRSARTADALLKNGDGAVLW